MAKYGANGWAAGIFQKQAIVSSARVRVSALRKTTRTVDVHVDPSIDTGIPAAEGDIPIPVLIGRRKIVNFNTIWLDAPITRTETVRNEPSSVMAYGTGWGALVEAAPIIPHTINILRGDRLNEFYKDNPDLLQETTTVTTTVDFAVGLCLGPDVQLLKIEDENGYSVWTGPTMGRDEFGVQGFAERIYFYPGSFDLGEQPVNPVILAAEGAALTPAFLGTSYVVFKGKIISDDALPIEGLGFELYRPVNPLALATGIENAELDQNIANAIVEVLTNEWTGVNMPFDYIDVPTFTAAAATLASENNWCSILVTTRTTAKAVVASLLQQADGCLRWNPATSKYEMKLYREDFDVALLPSFTLDNYAGFGDFRKDQWRNLPQIVTLNYIDRAARYTDTSTGLKVNDHVNAYSSTTESVALNGVVTNEVASIVLAQIAARVVTPLLAGSIDAGREAAPLLPGDVVKLTLPNVPGVVDLPMRITDKREAGKLFDTFVLGLEQAVLPAKNLRRPAAASLARSTTQVVQAPEDVDITVYAAPLFFLKNHGGTFRDGASETSAALTVPLFLIDSANAPAYSVVGYDEDFNSYSLADFASPVIVGTLDNALSADAGYSDGFVDIDITAPNWPDTSKMYDPGRRFGGYVLIGDEILQYQLGLGDAPTIELYRTARGLIDTVPQAHAAGATVYVLPDLTGVSRYGVPGPDLDIDVYGTNGRRASPGATYMGLMGLDTTRATLPACPQNAQINATDTNVHPRAANPTVTMGLQYFVTWEERDRLAGTIKLRGEGSQTPGEPTTYEVVLKSPGNTDVLATGVTGASVQVTIPLGLTAGPATIEITATNANGASLNKEIFNLTLA